jgi:protein disulfide-isomerase A6
LSPFGPTLLIWFSVPSNYSSLVRFVSDYLSLLRLSSAGHCKSLEPEWGKAASALKGIVKLGAVDADAHRELGGQYGVKGFPTIKIFGLDKSKASDYQGTLCPLS